MSNIPRKSGADAEREPPEYSCELNTELAYFTNLWESRKNGSVRHSPELWDNRAQEWISALDERDNDRRGMRARAAETAQYLKNRGLLRENDVVVDVGCGPGLFVAEFAKSAKHVTGLDYSARFIGYAKKYAAGQGRSNVSFCVRDFIALDIDAEGLAGAFDLVFTSITPAASGKGCMDKLMRMSRKWCYNASFVYAEDSLTERVSRDVFGRPLARRWDGMGFYALLNLLWLSGYYPETSYYDETRDTTAKPELSIAAKLASRCGYEGADSARRVLRYLEQAGETRWHSRFRYGVILWDVTRRNVR
jgi:SAM-dependent methyltransferase